MNVAFVLGNGRSRAGLDLSLLQQFGPVYGCNALYREFTPDVLVATDRPIAEEIQRSGYAQQNRFFTRQPIPGLGAHKLPREYKGMSSGPNAFAQACLDGYTTVYLIGFDLGATDGRFNNLYADTEFYKRSSDPPTFAGNWTKQLRQIAEQYNTRSFFRVCDKHSVHIPKLAELSNMKSITREQFENRLNNRKGIL